MILLHSISTLKEIVVFDSKEIAKRALKRAEEITSSRNNKQKRLKSAAILLIICIVLVAAIFTVFYAFTNAQFPNIDLTRVPLGASPPS